MFKYPCRLSLLSFLIIELVAGSLHANSTVSTARVRLSGEEQALEVATPVSDDVVTRPVDVIDSEDGSEEYLKIKKRASESALMTMTSYVKVRKDDFPGEKDPEPDVLDQVQNFYEAFFMLAFTSDLKSPWIPGVQKQSFQDFMEAMDFILNKQKVRPAQFLEVHSLGRAIQVINSPEDEIHVAKFLETLEQMHATYSRGLILHNFALNGPVIAAGMILGAIGVFVGSTFFIPVEPGGQFLEQIGLYLNYAFMGGVGFGVLALPVSVVRGAFKGVWEYFILGPRRKKEIKKFKESIQEKNSRREMKPVMKTKVLLR